MVRPPKRSTLPSHQLNEFNDDDADAIVVHSCEACVALTRHRVPLEKTWSPEADANGSFRFRRTSNLRKQTSEMRFIHGTYAKRRLENPNHVEFITYRSFYDQYPAQWDAFDRAIELIGCFQSCEEHDRDGLQQDVAYYIALMQPFAEGESRGAQCTRLGIERLQEDLAHSILPVEPIMQSNLSSACPQPDTLTERATARPFPDIGVHLYCLQWVNVGPNQGVHPMPFYKIGRGRGNRFKQVHGQNPVKLIHIKVWKNIGHIESRLHRALDNFRMRMRAGREYFDLTGIEDPIHFIEVHMNAIFKRIATTGCGN